MTAARRWGCVVLGVLLLVATPVLLRAVPASDADVTAVALLHRIERSRARAFSGYVETTGTVALPDNPELSSLGDLLGGPNRMRVWWRDPTSWRVDTLRTTGETDLVHEGRQTWRWEYESKEAALLPDVAVRLPNASDLLPTELARRSLSGARPGELRRIPPARVAGRDALGLRLVPADRASSIGRVDVYADARTGLPLRVDLFGRGSARPALGTAFDDVSLHRPDEEVLAFTPPDDSSLRFDRAVDLAAAADRFAYRVPPTRLAGLPARSAPRGSVGVYGRGPTVLLAVPLWRRTAERICHDLEGRPGVVELDQGLLVAASPLALLLSRPEPSGTAWLLAGTVTRAALARAADELAAHPPGLPLP